MKNELTTKNGCAREMLKIAETKRRAESEGLAVTEYALRQWVRNGSIPARKAGRTILLYWPNVRDFLTCTDGVGDAAAVLPGRH